MFTKQEQIEILAALGYAIDRGAQDLSRKSKIYGRSSIYVVVDGEKLEVGRSI